MSNLRSLREETTEDSAWPRGKRRLRGSPDDSAPSLLSQDTCTQSRLLVQAVKADCLDETARLLAARANPNATDASGMSVLGLAVSSSNFRIARTLLLHGADPSHCTATNDSPLHVAARKGELPLVALLLSFHADPNACSRTTGKTPLHYAAASGQTQCVSALLKAGGDPAQRDFRGKTSYSVAVPRVRLSLSSLTTIEEEQDASGLNLTEPDSPEELSQTEKQTALRQFLATVELEEYFEALTKAGFEDPESLLEQMNTPMPIDQPMLTLCGVTKPGHQKRLLLAIHRAALGKRLKKPKLQEDLRNWLASMRLEELHEQFEAAGYDDLPWMLAQMSSQHPITEQVLQTEVGVKKPGHRMRLLGRLLLLTSHARTDFSCSACALV